MSGRTSVLIFLVALGLVGSWLLGYREGEQTGAFRLLHEAIAGDTKNEQDGIDEGRDQVCDEIRSYKVSIAKDLDQHTQICCWTDMDGPENSN